MNEQLIEDLRVFLRAKGKLSEKIIMSESSLPSQGAYQRRFGSQSEAFLLAGYDNGRVTATKSRRRRKLLRDELIRELVRQSKEKITVVQPNRHWRARLRLRNGVLVSVYVLPQLRSEDDDVRWVLNPVPAESRSVSLLALLKKNEDGFEGYLMLRNLSGRTRLTLGRDHPLWEKGSRLVDFSDFAGVVAELRKQGPGLGGNTSFSELNR